MRDGQETELTPAALLETWRVSVRQGWAGEMSGLFAQPRIKPPLIPLSSLLPTQVAPMERKNFSMNFMRPNDSLQRRAPDRVKRGRASRPLQRHVRQILGSRYRPSTPRCCMGRVDDVMQHGNSGTRDEDLRLDQDDSLRPG